MTIRINQIAVDFTLEHETTLAQLTSSLRSWATAQNLAILGILADGKAFTADDQTALHLIHVVDVEAVPAGEQNLARAAVLARFFSLLSHAATTKDAGLVAELHQEFSSVRAAIGPLLTPLGPRLNRPLQVLDGAWDNPEMIGVAALQLAQSAELRRRELQDPSTALAETLSELQAALIDTEALVTLFQRGNDREALEKILSILTLWEDLVRRSAYVEVRDPQAWSTLQSELQPLLVESEAALLASDSILVTDLFEYEIAPRLRSAADYFPSIEILDPVPDVI